MMEKVNKKFDEQGFLIIKNFYNYNDEILPIKRGIFEIANLVLKNHNYDTLGNEKELFCGDILVEIAKVKRSLVAEIYDKIKQLPEFNALISSNKNLELFKNFRVNSMPGVITRGSGIRIDLPQEAEYRAHWHQEYPTQLSSIDGLVFWSPLIEITKDIGPVEVCVGSHKNGIYDVYHENNSSQSGAYSQRIKDIESIIKKHKIISPLLNPGDLLVMDFLTLHQSGVNIASQPRWSMQFRWFNFLGAQPKVESGL